MVLVLALWGPVAMLVLPGEAVAQQDPEVFPSPGLIEILPVADLVGDGQTESMLHVLVLTPDGQPDTLTGGFTYLATDMNVGSNGQVGAGFSWNSDANAEVLGIALTVGTVEGVRVDAVSFHASGSGVENVDVSSARLYLDANGNGVYEPATDTVQIGTAQTFTTDDDTVVFHAGTARQDARFVSTGGRVLGVTAFGDDIRDARDRAYARIDRVQFPGSHFRTDIAAKALRGGRAG